MLTKKLDMTTQVATPVDQPAAVYTQSADQNDQQLIQLWQKASKAERQKFMTWLAEQAN